MKTVIAPVDFSPVSNNAASYAADLALATGAELVLLNVVPTPTVTSEVPLPEYMFEELMDNANLALNELKTRLAFRTKGAVPVSIEAGIGSVEHEIHELVEHKPDSVVVMGITGAGGLAEFFIGSNTMIAVKHLRCPLLIIPQHASFQGFKRIGMACDLEDSASLPYDAIRRWLTAFPARLDVLHVDKTNGSGRPYGVGEAVALHNHLNSFHPLFHFIQHDRIEEGLATASEELKLDLLMVFPQKHGLMDLFGPRHTHKIVRRPQIPILVLHA